MNTAALAAFLSSGLCGVLAFLFLLRSRRSIAHWALVLGLTDLGVETALCGLTAQTSSHDEILRWVLWRLVALSLLPGLWLIFSLNYARGDSSNFFTRWRRAAALFLVAPPATALLFRSDLLAGARVTYPDAHWTVLLGWSGSVVYAGVLLGSILVIMNLERTFRAAVGIIRWRIKFMVLGVGLLFVVRVYTSTQALLYRGIDVQLDTLNSVALMIACVLIARSFFRTREVEVDVYPSQSVLQNSITVLLAGVYLVVVGVLAKVAAYVGGDSEFALKAFLTLFSLVLLAILLQSDRARMHLRRFVSRNFQRPLYDYRTVWRTFTEGTASKVEQPDLCRSLVRLMAEVFQALSVALWLLDEETGTLVLAASTFLPESGGSVPALQPPQAIEVLRQFGLHPGPADFETSDAGWAASLREVHPGQFPNGGRRMAVPLMSQGDVIGFISLGDRVGGAPLSVQDQDMLKCVADHAAAGVRTVQLSQKLLQARELEAFQTMAAFFVHDLKNAASTLNLTLQNLPIHFDDPAFREDSLRAISKTVTHINRLIGRLSELRHEHAIQADEADLNEIVTRVLDGLEPALGALISKDLAALPPVAVDREQASKVITNLVLNAAEALSKNGRVRVETRVEGGWVVLSVADNGSGMSPEFLTKGLFRPFQTTKKGGLGIGMFQSKMIVEAHGGRIAVASEVGKGTTFQVFLPLPKRAP
jgi:putative PEP-CTERM system histidine kinase